MRYFMLLAAAFLSTACQHSQPDNSVVDAVAKQQECTAADTVYMNADSTICSLKIDGYKVSWIRDNASRKNNELKLFGEVPAGLIDSLGIANGIPSSMSAVLLQCDTANVLFDAGLGMPGCLLLSSLDSLGVKAETLDRVYLTHLHPDHIGGLMANGQKVFPNAKVYVAKAEYDAWMNMLEDKNQMQVAFAKLYADNMVLFEFNDTLPVGVVALDAKGHTPGHTVFEAGKFLIVGDLFHGLALQMAHPEFCAFYDMDPENAVKSREKFISYAKEKGSVMLGMHFPEPGFVK